MNCPYCAEPIEKDDAKCKACGEAIAKRPSALSGSDPIDPTRILGWAMKDPNWIQKGLVGTACFLGGVFLFPFFALFGYKLRCARQQLEMPGHEGMPEWDRFGELIVDGLKLFISLMLVSFVVVLLFGLFVGAMVGLDLATTGKAPGAFTAVGGMIAYMAFFGFMMIFQIAVLPAIELEYLETGAVTSALHFGALWRRMTTRFSDYLTMAVVYFLIGMVAQFAGLILCVVGVYFSTPVGMFTQGALLGRYLAQQRVKDAALQA